MTWPFPRGFLVPDTLDRRTTWTEAVLQLYHDVTLRMIYEIKVENFIPGDFLLYAYFPSHDTNSTATIFLQGKRISSFLLSALLIPFTFNYILFDLFFFSFFLETRS